MSLPISVASGIAWKKMTHSIHRECGRKPCKNDYIIGERSGWQHAGHGPYEHCDSDGSYSGMDIGDLM